MYNNNHTIILTKVTLVIQSFKKFNYFREERPLIGIYYIRIVSCVSSKHILSNKKCNFKFY